MTSTAWIDGPVLAFDTETTGIDVRSDRLVTVGLVRREGGARQVRTWLADPGIEIPAGATAIHGVSTQQARAEGRPAPEVAEEVAGILADAMGAGIPVVAFNAAYDLTLLDAELARYGLPTLAARLGREVGPIIDPLVIDRGLNRYRKGKRTLDALCDVYGVAVGVDMHRAENDAALTLDVLEAMVARSAVLAELSADDLHARQVTWHRDWATNFNSWLSSRGRTPDADPTWPIGSVG